MSLGYINIFGEIAIVWNWFDALKGVGIAIVAILTAKYVANLFEYILLHIVEKTKTAVDDALVRATISTFRISALLFGFVGFFYFETKFLLHHLLRYDIIFIICVYLVITVFGLKLLNVGYKEIKKYAQPPRSYFELNVLRPVFFSLRVILITVLILLIMQINGFPASVLWIIIGVASLVVILFSFVIFYEASSAIFVRSNIPIKIGDIVRIDGNLGSVVEFGLRFIKLLTPENSHVYIPYKTMKDKLLENLTERQSRRYRFSMHLPWGVTAKDVEKFLKKANKFLVDHEDILSTDSAKNIEDEKRNEFGDIGNPFAYLVGMDDEGVEILIQYRIAETDFHLGAKISEKIVLGLMKLAEKEGVLTRQNQAPADQIEDKKKKTPEKKTAKSTPAKKETKPTKAKTEDKLKTKAADKKSKAKK